MKRAFLIFMLCLLGFVNPMRAQETVTIGSGIERSSAIPVDLYYPYGLNQQIYFSNEIGMGAGTINGISLKFYDVTGFNMETPITNAAQPTRQFEIYMQNTDLSNLNDGYQVVNDAPLYSATVTLVENGWTQFDFSTPFEYTGGNILFTLVDVTGQSAGNDYYPFFIYDTATTDNLCVVSISESKPNPAGEQSYLNPYSKRSQIQLHFGNAGSGGNVGEPVYDILATQVDQSNVDVVWSWNEIVPQTLVANFETGDFSQADFVNDMNYPWVITEDAYEGTYAIKSSNQGQQDTKSSIEITVDAPNDGYMSFYHRISCEYYFDNGYFYIDGVERSLVTDKVEWEYKEYPITKGKHTYRWSFVKDFSDYTTGEDTYYVDNITLYAPTKEFAGGWIYYDDGNYQQAMNTDAENNLTKWGISFPATEEYAGYNLTKLSYYPKNPGTVTANIYLGGTDAPGELVASKMFAITTTEQFVELPLDAPVALDGTQPLWITFATYDWYMATGCNYSGNRNSDWFLVGDEWKHMTDISEEMNMGTSLYYTWMMRGYLENSRGEVAVLSNDRGADNVTGYNVYRNNTLTEEVETLATNITDTTYRDSGWGTAEYGIYKWGVSALYGTEESEVIWSNDFAKDMYTTVNVKVTTNSGDSPAGAKVHFVNISEPGMGYEYRVRVDESGEYTWDKFRRGTYEYTVALEGFESDIIKETIEIFDAASLECTLREMAAAVDNLYVSSTGFATWQAHDFDNGGGEFFFDFDNGTIEGWRLIDADGDGFNWRNTNGLSMLPGHGVNQSKYCLTSASWDTVGAITPNNYIVTENAYLMVEDSQLTYYVCAQDDQNPTEHYGVAVTTTPNAAPEDFTMIWEETLSAKSGSRAQTTWEKRTLQLGDYAGQNVYIAFRHFDVTGQYRVNIDDARLVNNGKSSRAVESYTIKLNGEVVAENVQNTYYQHENYEAGQTYTTTVIANYTTLDSEGAEYTWTAASCEDYEGVVEVTGRAYQGRAIIEWRMEGDEEQQETQTSFYSSFNDGELSGWTTIDADGDGYNWCSSDSLLGENGYNGYKDGLFCAMSQSYSGIEAWGLHPDNYMVTPEKYLITENSQLTFVVCAQDPGFPEEHYGVAISMLSNTNAADFTTIWEETIEDDDPDVNTPQTDWKLKTVDLSAYAGEEVYIALRHFNCTDQYMICVDDVELVSGERTAKRSELIGFNVYCDDALIAEVDPSLRGVRVDFPGDDEYDFCVRAVYSDYGMSCPECVTIDAPMICIAPEDLYAEEIFNENGESGIQLTWPYQAPPMSEWLYYDDNTPVTAIGLNGGAMYWAVMFPAESLSEYIGTSVTKVKVYDLGSETGEAAVLVSYGSLFNPGESIAIKSFSFDGNAGWKEVELPQAVEITGEDNLWITVFQSGMSHPAAVSADCGDPNARWISANGMQWQDLGAFGAQYELTFMLRAFVTNEAETEADVTRELITLETPEVNPSDIKVSMLDKPVFAPRATEFSHYNIYRGTSEDNFEVIATTTEGTYFDTDVEAGETYYYKVTATYVDGDDECESEAANSFYQPNKNYVVVDYTSIVENGVSSMMIYPNPAKDNMIVKAEDMKRITIVNTMGQVVYDQEVMSDSKEINMSQFESGVYIIRITTGNGMATSRVTVVK